LFSASGSYNIGPETTMTTQEKAVQVFTTKLACKRRLGEAQGSETSGLSCFLAAESSVISMPSLKMTGPDLPAETAAKQLKAPLEADKHRIGVIPQTILQNVSQAFGKMIDQRLPAVLKMANKEQSQVAALMASGQSIPTSFTCAETKFRPLPLSKGFVKELGRSTAIILPLVFKLIIDISFFGSRSMQVTITAPGTVIGTFSTNCQRIQSIKITIDTESVYRQMSDRCDQVVLECLQTATELSSQIKVLDRPRSFSRETSSPSKPNRQWGSAA
jgi:citrate lyase gamma subunit